MCPKKKVLIVDDQVLPRQLFAGIITSSDRYELAAAIETAKMADVYCAAGVDLILMDVVMKDGFSGLEASARIKRSYPGIRILMVTSMPDAMFLKRAREIGVDSFWYKEVQRLLLLEIMDRTMQGGHIFPDAPPVVSLGLAKSTEFTERELDVLRLLAEGFTDKEIAEHLFLSVTTVRYHVNNLLSKTGHSSRTELAVNAVKSGLVIPGIR